MPFKSRGRRKSISLQAAELAAAVPQVVAHRVGRMVAAGPLPNARDQREFHRMVAEKIAAFGESWQAMGQHAWRSHHALGREWLRLWTTPWAGGTPPVAASARTIRSAHDAALEVIGSGLAPVHRRAIANARRLGRKPIASAKGRLKR